ncbi:MAG: hypothetical protein A3G32_02895 [Deltaproteobacteria bacterium RIFCSPLOWO2_12_FULL_40_28]|nr:MAG: hypothetical protein A3C45_00275 [Deltaproteobacteria bacterium RIFCSPHIGHO2_02_FULL_40_28]OGQ20063.1 MAG: hypothetical protein A3E27_02940 [Deltaproteobacteria bacterium RIFCSPHIGHO2_12_FULL_40_32]OGQ40630.1 MAG: hypothetical protein A3I69_10365 [Deltaproteobacteria bacterium RIFCSPLOWO2_02_FULL_40_36]OGQ54299.1 MAG: hypothetical protein A3G32_02895 [Deltaproteobacteria bacterium RIFCSPLOWO2_12_FULL_40_28]
MIHLRSIVILFFLFVVYSLFVFNSFLFTQIDELVYFYFHGLANNAQWFSFWRKVTIFGNGSTLYLIVLLWWLFSWIKNRNPWPGFIFEVALFLGLQLNFILKILTHKVRPFSLDPDYFLSTYSYPSGHAFGSFLVFVFLFISIDALVKKIFFQNLVRFFCIICAGLIPLSRLALGVHWFSDVVGGILLGMFWFLVYLKIVSSNPKISPYASISTDLA